MGGAAGPPSPAGVSPAVLALVEELGDEVRWVEKPEHGWRVLVASTGHELAPTVAALEAWTRSAQKRKASSALRVKARAKKVDEGRSWDGLSAGLREELLQRYPRVVVGPERTKAKAAGGKKKGEARKKKCLLVLDVNGLLVHRERPQNRDAVTATLKRGPDRAFPRFVCWDRPYVRPFLRWALRHFNVGVWSSMMPVNVATLVAHTFGEVQKDLSFVHGRPMCDVIDGDDGNDAADAAERVTKRLDKVWQGFGEEFTLLLDDSVHKTRQVNPEGTWVVPQTFHPARVGASDDTSLGPEGEITMYLAKLLEAVEVHGKTVREFVLANPLASGAQHRDEAAGEEEPLSPDVSDGKGAVHEKRRAEDNEGRRDKKRKATSPLVVAPPVSVSAAASAAVPPPGSALEMPPQEKYETAAEYGYRSRVYMWALAALGDPMKALTACKVASNVHRLGATYPPEVMENIRRFMPDAKPKPGREGTQ